MTDPIRQPQQSPTAYSYAADASNFAFLPYPTPPSQVPDALRSLRTHQPDRQALGPHSISPLPFATSRFSPAEATPNNTAILDGLSLTPELLTDIGYDWSIKIALSDEAWAAVRRGRQVVDDVISRNQVAYGINTGFGNFSSVVIPPGKLGELQENLIRSHASGTSDWLTPERTRMMLALRINVLAKGHSGIRAETLEQIIAACNACVLPAVPSKGTVGASGDLAPLSHLALGMMGEGKMYDPTLEKYDDAAAVLARHKLTPVKLQAKEGLALINGTQFIAALGAEAVVRANRCAKQADVVAALTLEALKGTVRAFHPLIHNARPHSGQIAVAGRLRSLLHKDETPSEISLSHKNCGQVQDSYTMRCCPQVHGITHDTIAFVHGILSTELNSATDNPMVFPTEDPLHGDVHLHEHEDDHKHPQLQGFIISGGNFHGEYPAKALDYLAIGIHEISSVSERRIERMVNPALSNLPAFLVKEGGLNSGFMIAHCAAASLVSENKVLCHPSSVDSLSTSAAKEDHVSMGGFSARKALQVVEHVETVVAIELLAACQAIEFLRPLTSTPALERLHALVRTVARPWDRDRQMFPDIEEVKKIIQGGRAWEAVKEQIEPQYR